MDAGRTLWLLLPRRLRELPADLAAVVLLVVSTNFAVFAPIVSETPLRIGFGLVFVLFVPGYAFIAALFPEAAEDVSEGDEPDQSGIDGIERVALSFGLSIAIVPLIGLILNFTPWGIRLEPVMIAVSGVTLVFTAVAASRRNALPEEEQFQVPYQTWLSEARAELFEPDSRTDAALNVLLVVSVLLATASVGYAVMVPKQGEAFTELYLLTEQDGELVADDYPTNYTIGESKPVIVGVGNHEHREMDYTVVVQLQRVEIEGNSTRVLESQELDRLQMTLGDNETWQQPIQIAPTMTGERLRLTFMLYRGEPPADISTESAYRETHLWVNVSRTG